MTTFRFILLLTLACGGTVLHGPATRGEVEAVKRLLDSGADVDATNKDNLTALHMVAFMDRADVVTALLEHGADAEAQEKNGVTALHVAAQVGQADVAKRLLEAGADVEARTTDGWTPRDLGKNKHKDIIRLLDQATSS